jgi:acylphosphatase
MPIERLEARVLGRVQGVGFRFFVLRLADELDLTGWVANEPDGSVRVVAEGPRAALEALRDRLEVGPPAARVERVVARFGPATGEFAGFGVRYLGHGGD